MNRFIAVALVLGAGSSFAFGPAVEAGATITLIDTIRSNSSSEVKVTPMVGPVVRAGFEIGERFNHALVFEFTNSSGSGMSQGFTVPVGIRTFAGRYTFSVDFLKKRGFTPSVGIGIAAGVAQVDVDGSLAQTFYLAFHGQAGVRYGFENGFGLRFDLAVSTYGGFIGLQPTVGASWRF